MNKRTAYSVVVLVVTLLAICLPVFGISCAPKQERVIKVGFWGDMTGPVADAYREPVFAAIDSYRWLNEKEGGIDGIKVELLWSDTGYTVPRALSAYKRFADAGAVVMSSQASQEAEAVRANAERDRIPIVTAVASPRTLVSSEWIFTIEQLPAADQFAGFAEYLKKTPGPKPIKLAILGWDNEMGRSPIIAAKRYEAEGVIKVVAEEYFSPVASDFTTQVLRVKETAADWIYIQASIPATLGVMRDLGKYGITVKVCSSPTSTPDDLLRIGGSMLEGHYTNLQSVLPDENVPGVKFLNQMHQEYRGSPAGTGYFFGWVKHRVIIEALKMAIKDVGFDNLNGTAVRDTILKIKNLDMMGIIPPVSFTREDPRGMKYIKMVQIKNGKFVSVTDWVYAPFIKE